MAILQPLHNIAEICSRKDISEAILCPGSRSAALTLSFVRHPKIQTFSISDERSAAFIGMGMAQQTQRTVTLVCTSGTAVYNFAPAVTEAFFQEIPLLVLTADRPKEWIHQQDGQTIYQNEIFGKHVKKSFELPSDYAHPDARWQIERVVNEAINLSQTLPKGPVHINVPIREPFYPNSEETISFDKDVRIIRQIQPIHTLPVEDWNDIFQIWNQCEKRLIAVGQTEYLNFEGVLKQLQEEFCVPVLGDVISNLDDDFVKAHDSFLASEEADEKLQADLLITCGRSFISKNLKLFLRKYKPRYHVHLQMADTIIDPFQTITHKIQTQPKYFFEKLFEDLDFEKFKNGDEEEENIEYFDHWNQLNKKYISKIQYYIENTQFSAFQAIHYLFSISPENSIFHLGNSMSIRYANLTAFKLPKNIQFFSNRGTSGIDGCLSTAVGAALMTEQLVFCLLGDVSFFYDKNALWNNYLPKNLRIILMNNHGGNIFRIIEGPNRQPELEEYFETQQKLDAEHVAKDADLNYLKASNLEELKRVSIYFLEKSAKAMLLEIETDAKTDAEVFQEYKTKVLTKG